MKMTAIFGTAWTSQYPDEKMLEFAKRTWAVEIEKLTMAELQKGFENITNGNLKFAPSLSAFVGYCKTKPIQKTEMYKPLPKPVANRKKVFSEIQEMKSTLRIKAKQMTYVGYGNYFFFKVRF